MPPNEIAFRRALDALMERVGEPVHAVLQTHRPDDPPSAVNVEGTLKLAETDQLPPVSEATRPVTFGFEEHEATFRLDPETVVGTHVSETAVTVDQGSVTIKVVASSQDDVPVPVAPRADEPEIDPVSDEPGDAKAGARESATNEPAEDEPAAQSASDDLGRRGFWRWANLPLPSSTIGSIIGSLLTALVLVVIGALAGVFDDPELWPAPNGPTKVEPFGDVSGPTHIRIVKQKGVVNSYVVDDRIAHHMQTRAIYLCNVGHYPVRWNVDQTEWNDLVDRDKIGENQACPAGGQPVLMRDADVIKGNYILRTGEGDSWLIIDEQRVPIVDGRDEGPIFSCLVERYLVWDYVDIDEVESFPAHPTMTRARC